MNSFVSKLIAFLAAIVIFVLVWLPVGMLMAFAGGYVAILGLAWGVVCYLAAKKGYKWILDKLLKRSAKEEVINVEDLSIMKENDEEVIHSKDI